MPEKDPLNWTLGTWVIALLMASGGGLINWFSHAKRRNPVRFSIVELLGEIFTSGFVGIGVFMVAASYEQPTALCAAAAGISGHMATRLLFLVENWVLTKAEQHAPGINAGRRSKDRRGRGRRASDALTDEDEYEEVEVPTLNNPFNGITDSPQDPHDDNHS